MRKGERSISHNPTVSRTDASMPADRGISMHARSVNQRSGWNCRGRRHGTVGGWTCAAVKKQKTNLKQRQDKVKAAHFPIAKRDEPKHREHKADAYSHSDQTSGKG